MLANCQHDPTTSLRSPEDETSDIPDSLHGVLIPVILKPATRGVLQ